MAECNYCDKGAADCPRCKGEGRIWDTSFWSKKIPCTSCTASGKVKCGVCGGTGKIWYY